MYINVNNICIFNTYVNVYVHNIDKISARSEIGEADTGFPVSDVWF